MDIIGAIIGAALNSAAYLPPPPQYGYHPPAQAYAYAAPPAPQQIDVGQVKFIQQALNFLSHGNLAVDGVWGQSTFYAVWAWQQSHGISPTGYFDYQTLASITREIGLHDPVAPQQ